MYLNSFLKRADIYSEISKGSVSVLLCFAPFCSIKHCLSVRLVMIPLFSLSGFKPSSSPRTLPQNSAVPDVMGQSRR